MKKIHKLLILLALVCTLVVCCMVSASAAKEIQFEGRTCYTDDEEKYIFNNSECTHLIGVTENFSNTGWEFCGMYGVDNVTTYALWFGNTNSTAIYPLKTFTRFSMMPNTQNYVEDQALSGQLIFENAFSLMTVEGEFFIPYTVTGISESAFSFSSIGSFRVDTNNKAFYNDENGILYGRVRDLNKNGLYFTGESYVIMAPNKSVDHIEIPDNTSIIYSYAYYYYNAKTINFPTSIKQISNAAFPSLFGSKFDTVYYEGTIDQWNEIGIGDSNDRITKAHLFCNDWYTVSEQGCFTDEVERRDCHCSDDCGEYETRVIKEAFGSHNFTEQLGAVRSTCATQGYIEYHCSRCDRVKVYEPLDETNHEGPYGTRNAKTATCITAGKLADTYCTACGVTTEVGAETDPPIGEHIMMYYTNISNVANCKTAGTKVLRCKYYTTCKKQEITYDVLNPDVHYGGFALRNNVDATCCTDGYSGDYYCIACDKNLHTCEAAGYGYKPDENCNGCCYYTNISGTITMPRKIKAKGDHTFGDWVTTLEPTCVALGEERRDCTVGDYFETRELAIVDVHVYDDNWKVIKAPTCISEGIEERRCTLCGEVPEERPISPTGIHTWRDNWFVIIQPTCTTPGLERHYCYYCSAFETREIEPVAHIYRHWESMLLSQTDPTCTTPGEAIYKCHWYDECGTTDTEELPVVDHAYGEYEEVTPANCIKDGLEVAKCQWFDECGKDISQPIPATGEHVWANAPFNIVLSTCTTYGYKEYRCVYHESGCTEINKVSLTALDPDNHAGPINHDLNKKDPTCCSAGYSGDTYCTACDAVMWKGESIPATGKHVWKEAERFGGNCKISGYIKYRCENGTAEYKEDLGVNNSKHYKTEVRNYKAGNCQTMGYSGDEYCTHCNTLIRKGKEIKGSHVGRQNCEICGYNVCGCQLCHGNGFERFIMKMFLWIYMIFGQNKTCACGNVHY